ncbi:unnamed protein product [Heligmosomoides polygyrus]|uniref:Secreted protein n=1 Tax=Heligmosomoides polygyrus TaxID=6339 RepID=A0A183FTQ3_HELPZ|nr:unnamed protein product [Heligmosomoides polygyrus]
MKLVSVISLLAVGTAVPECYLPFLTATVECKSLEDCPSGVCVYSINRMQRVCCEPKAGAVQPECPSGKPSSLPILCDPESNELDICPDDYECRESVTDFEKVRYQFPVHNIWYHVLNQEQQF